MARYAQILPDPGRAISHLFTYRIPEHLRESVVVGAQVLIPFGPRTVAGVVAALSDTSDRAELREMEALLEEVPALPADALALAEWIANYYLCEFGAALRPFFTEGMSYRIGRRVRRTEHPFPPNWTPDEDAARILAYLEEAGKEVGLPLLRRLVPWERLKRTLRTLKAQQLVTERATIIPPKARERQRRMLEVAATAAAVEQYCAARVKRARGKVACLQAAVEAGPVTTAELAARASVSTSTVQALIKDGMLRSHWIPVRRTPWGEAAGPPVPPPALTADQQPAVAALCQAVEAQRYQSFLLFGVTASGKTEVFLRAITRVLARGQQAIVLLPEISLTAQAVSVYRGRFGDRVAVLHSGLSLGERWDEWQRIRTGEAAVIIGARSAIFAPVRSLGMIVVDEEHESSYKQEQEPRYHAREVALKRGELNACPVVLATATPALETFYEALTGRHTLLRLPTRIDSRPLPAVRTVDMRGARESSVILSTPLRQAIAARLAAGEQVIIFLNRRGFATFLLCPICGEAVRCPDCGVSLKYHGEARQVRCHHCNLTRAAPDCCAKCGGRQIRFSGFGTERVEQEIRSVFPFARIGRMDRDTTVRKGAHVRIVSQFRTAETNVLIGTQMVAKGFDFPKVTLVGVVSADTSLNLPDFRAAERTFQLLTQVAGRAGRGEKLGTVIIQTYRPEDPSVVTAEAQDYEAFYLQELVSRQELGYPPFAHIANIVVTGGSEKQAQQSAGALAEALLMVAQERGVTILGPAPAPLERLRGKFRWHLIVKGKAGLIQQVIREGLARTGERIRETVTVDVDAMSMM